MLTLVTLFNYLFLAVDETQIYRTMVYYKTDAAAQA
jgi:hypothetical protein